MSEAGRRLPMEQTEIFAIFEDVADWVWNQVETWDWKAQRTIGIQLITATDSINANLVEGDGRHSGPDSLRFFIIARGSGREARLWLKRAISRGLVEERAGTAKVLQLESATKQLNLLINFRRGNKGALHVHEATVDYEDGSLQSSNPAIL